MHQIRCLVPGKFASCLGIVTIVATLDATTPTNARSGSNIPPSIQPVVVSRALQGVYARLVDWVRVVRHSNEHVISIGGVISNAAAFKTAMVGRLVFSI